MTSLARTGLRTEHLAAIAGTSVFLTLGILGWAKLKYGFNFIDEGMYMTDGWRLAMGDRLFPDSSISAILPFALFNAAIFKAFPDITLLAFRGLQFWCAILSMIALGAALYSWTRTYWYLPLSLAVFAFTGLEPIGMSANMSYYTYPHMFLALHIAGLLFAMHYDGGAARHLLMLGSGIFMWAAGFAALYMTVTGVMVFLLWYLLPPKEPGNLSLTGRDVALLVAPAVILWSLFLLVHGPDFIAAVLDMQRYSSEDLTHLLIKFNPLALQYLGVTAVLLILATLALRLTGARALLGLAGVSAFAFMTIATNLLGLIEGYWRGWFSAQMWAASFLAVTLFGILFSLIRKRLRGENLDPGDQLIAVLAVPTGMFALVSTLFSGLGILTVLHVGIPAVLAGALFYLRGAGPQHWPVRFHALGLGAILLPFCYHLAWADWEFTYFDLNPARLTHTLKHGFAEGIVTNELYASMIYWMEERSQQYSREGDFAITLDEAAMGYMIIKRRPALNHSWTGFSLSRALRKESIEAVVRNERHPKIAFRFIRAPLFFPNTGANGKGYALGGVRNFPAEDPISAYIIGNMQLVEKLTIQDSVFVELYVRPDANGVVKPLDLAPGDLAPGG